MTCQECELALAGEEQGEERSSVIDGCVEAHMAECSACREFALELRENSDALRAFAMETLPGLKVLPQELPGVRHNGQPGGRQGRQHGAWWAAVAAVVVLGFVSSWAMLRSRSARLSSPPVLSLKTPPAPMASAASIEQGAAKQGVAEQGVAQAILSPAGLETVPSPVRRHVARRPQQALREPRILQVKMLTDDPDVVIYWQIEN
jgi:hypothetical protein